MTLVRTVEELREMLINKKIDKEFIYSCSNKDIIAIAKVQFPRLFNNLYRQGESK